MKPKDKEKLIRARPTLVRTLDVTNILSELRGAKVVTSQEEAHILADTRRRQRTVIFLDMLEKKKTEVYETFLDIISAHYPHLLLVIDEGADDDLLLEDDEPPEDDEWATLHRTRGYLIKEIDAATIVPYMRKKNIITEDDEHLVMSEDDCFRRTEAFLDILEMKDPMAYDHFLDAIGETYPHVYLTLTSGDRSDNDSDDDFLL